MPLTANQQAAIRAEGTPAGVGGLISRWTGIVRSQQITITKLADLAGLGAGVKTLDKNLGAALPTGARLVAVTCEGVTLFDDATHGTWSLTIGTAAGGTQIGTALNVAAGQTNFPKAFAAGVQGYNMAPQSAAQISARITSSVDLNTATGGAATLVLWYMVQP